LSIILLENTLIKIHALFKLDISHSSRVSLFVTLYDKAFSMKNLLIFLLAIISFQAHSQWIQKGDVFAGLDSNDNIGYSLCMDDPGNILAIGTVNNNSGGNVSVYSYESSNWSIMGNPLLQSNTNDSFGEVVCLNKFGDILAVSAPSANGNGGHSGIVKLFEWDGIDWVQKGSSINGQNNSEHLGQSMDVSADGLTIALGVNGDTGIPGEGMCRVYEWNGVDNWVQKGSDIVGEAINDLFGYSVDLDYEGDIVAVGGRNNDGSGLESGHARVYSFNGTDWVQMGSDIDGENAGDWAGYSITMDSTGHLVAVGSRMNDETATDAGQVRLFEWDGNEWTQKGSSLYGEGDFAHFGAMVKLNRQGTFIAIGSPEYDADTTGGRTYVYGWDGNDWELFVNPIEMSLQFGWFGHAIDIADSGTDVLVSIGAPNTNLYGEVRVFQANYKSANLNEESLQKIKLYPNPASSVIHIDTGLDVLSSDIYNTQGKLISTFSGKSFDVSDFDSGIYIIRIRTATSTFMKRVIIE